MWLSLLVLLVFSLLYEALIVAYTISVAEKRRMAASILSAIIEPVKLVSLLMVVDSTNKWVSVLVVSLACGLGNYWTISAVCKMGVKTKKKKIEPPQSFKEST
jgi:hypothetical protein